MTETHPNLLTRSQRVTRLIVILICIAVIWLGALPWIGRLPAVEKHLQTLRDGHIDAGVMFYSEFDSRVIPDRAQVKEFLKTRNH